MNGIRVALQRNRARARREQADALEMQRAREEEMYVCAWLLLSVLRVCAVANFCASPASRDAKKANGILEPNVPPRKSSAADGGDDVDGDAGAEIVDVFEEENNTDVEVCLCGGARTLVVAH